MRTLFLFAKRNQPSPFTSQPHLSQLLPPPPPSPSLSSSPPSFDDQSLSTNNITNPPRSSPIITKTTTTITTTTTTMTIITIIGNHTTHPIQSSMSVQLVLMYTTLMNTSITTPSLTTTITTTTTLTTRAVSIRVGQQPQQRLLSGQRRWLSATKGHSSGAQSEPGRRHSEDREPRVCSSGTQQNKG